MPYTTTINDVVIHCYSINECKFVNSLNDDELQQYANDGAFATRLSDEQINLLLL